MRDRNTGTIKVVIFKSFRIAIGNYDEKEDTNMTKEQKIAAFERMLRRAPEILTPKKVCSFSPLSKNKVYELIKTKELRSFVYRGGYIVSKADLIEYLADHCDDASNRCFAVAGGDEQ